MQWIYFDFSGKKGLNAKVLSVKGEMYYVEANRKMSSLKDTIKKIKSLEAEKKNLLLEVEELKKMADAKANALESEIASLREEVKSLKNLMDQEQQE